MTQYNCVINQFSETCGTLYKRIFDLTVLASTVQ